MEGSLLWCLRDKLAESMAMAFWNRERSSSSSGTEIEIRRGGRIFGAKKKNKIVKERRRIRVGISGDDVEQAMAMNEFIVHFLFKTENLEHQTVTETRILECMGLKRGKTELGFHIWWRRWTEEEEEVVGRGW